MALSMSSNISDNIIMQRLAGGAPSALQDVVTDTKASRKLLAAMHLFDTSLP